MGRSTRSVIRLLGSLCLVAVAAVGPSTLRSTDAGTRRAAPQSAPGKGTNQVALAHRLAAQLNTATSAGARRTALLKIMRALSIGVYTPGGKAIVHGTERSNGDFYLYDPEIRSLAEAMAGSRSYTLADVGGFLAQLQLTVGDRPIDPALLQQTLQEASGAALQSPTDRAGLSALLIRELGLLHTPSYDVSSNLPPDQIKLDAAQFFILNAGLLLPLVQHQGLQLAAARAVTAYARITLSPSQSGCPQVKPEPKGPEQVGDDFLWKSIKKIAGQLNATVKTGLQIKKLIGEIIDGLHGMTLSAMITVTPLQERVQTHYGPAGHDSNPLDGRPINFQVRVVMNADLGADTIQCLALAGIHLPKKGPIQGVPILWNITAQSDIRKYGTLSPAPGALGSVSTTDAQGIATLTFTPNNEKYPDIGFVFVDSGVVDSVVKWASAFGNTLGKFNELFTPVYTGIRWEVGYHKPAGFKVSFHWRGTEDERPEDGDSTDTVSGDEYIDYQLTGNICSSDPYGKQPFGNYWTFAMSGTGGDRSEGTTYNAFPTPSKYLMTLDPSGTFRYGPTHTSLSVDFSSAKPTATLRIEPGSTMMQHTDTPTMTVSVQNDDSCPSPQPGPQ